MRSLRRFFTRLSTRGKALPGRAFEGRDSGNVALQNAENLRAGYRH